MSKVFGNTTMSKAQLKKLAKALKEVESETEEEYSTTDSECSTTDSECSSTDESSSDGYDSTDSDSDSDSDSDDEDDRPKKKANKAKPKAKTASMAPLTMKALKDLYSAITGKTPLAKWRKAELETEVAIEITKRRGRRANNGNGKKVKKR